ncbi:signal-induced proliferation-associated 1-like protein 1 isoform X3 [Eriocheir sinensis]|uniref:signal-induced proliferation-associated 1-like protein 1 isoform X3 n=1 Tax=Eriocheir sinensis TaxID=95602 RepID=UPI0021C595E7|nr:signal-induced proliferation-associated 1-like protein 1 isoform X3 [Eriocheir sinensis]
MRKAEVMNVGPAAVMGRGTAGRALAGLGGPVSSLDCGPLLGAAPAHSANVINNNVEANGLEDTAANNNNNNNNKTSNSNNNNNGSSGGSSSSNNSSHKSSVGRRKGGEGWVGDGVEQGSLGYVSERVRALSISDRSRGGGHRFGSADLRASYNERLRSGPTSLQPPGRAGPGPRPGQEVGGGFVYLRGPMAGGLYRSNSSLDLEHEGEEPPPPSPLRREYGSHGSINVAAAPPEALYSILRDLQPPSQALRGTQSEVSGAPVPGEAEATSPKARSKFQRLWDRDKSSIFKKLRSSKGSEAAKADNASDSSGSGAGRSQRPTEANGDSDSRGEDVPAGAPARRSAFAHYDCRSMAAQFSTSQTRQLLAERSNTTTGASAAAMAAAPHHDSTEDLGPEELDPGDGRSNSLINSCPFFRNELGGEGERVVSLSRDWGSGSSGGGPLASASLHRPVAASTLGLLEPLPGLSHWQMTLCPYVRSPLTVEAVDQGATYYRNYFCGQEHHNWFGMDDTLGPVAVSIRREKVEEAMDSAHSLPTYQHRLIVRSAELFSCQGTVLEESLGRPGGEKGRSPGVREALEYVCPQLSLSCLRLGQSGSHTEEALARLDELGVHNKFKVGVLYCRAGQTTEEEMYNNESAGPAFSEFLEMLGQRVRLKDFDKYRGGLDKKTDSTGLYSVYNQYRDMEVMFHVSTLLPFTPNNRKQLLRKRHIGNDIVTIIFQEPGAPPFSPRHIRSHFQHVFIVVQAINPCTENTQYRVTVSRFRDVPLFGPMMPEGATFPKSKAFTDFLLAKAINGEMAALRSEKFAAMATRTRHEYLKDLALNHSTSTTLDTSTKFSLMGFSRGSKKDKRGIKYIPEASVRGALSWPLTVHDAALQQNVDCVLGISADSLVVVEEASAAVIFAAPCKSVIGWTLRPQQGLRVFYHQGECLLVHLRPGTPEAEGEEVLAEVVARLSAVTQGAETQDLVLRRNPAGLLGFNVQQDGVITEVEPYGLASQAGLRQGARLVEICTVTLATLSQEQMVDLLKTSMTVTVTVVPPHPDGAPRRGCNVPTCGFLLGGSEGDYENLTTPEQLSGRKHHHHHHHHHHPHHHRKSHHREGPSSSGYGTGSSSRSFSDHLDPARTAPHTSLDHPGDRQNNNTTTNNAANNNNNNSGSSSGDYETAGEGERSGGGGEATGTLSSTSSGHSSDRWTEPLDEPADSPPPPLPARSAQSTKRRGEFFHPFQGRGTTSSPATHHHHPQHPHQHQPAFPTPQQPPPSASPTTYPTLHHPTYTSSSPAPPPTTGCPSASPSPTLAWPHLPHESPQASDNDNYAVPPPHPRPLLPATSEESSRVPSVGDYDNAPLRPSEATAAVRVRSGSSDHAVPSPPPGITQGQVSEYLAWRNERLNGNMRSSSLPGHLPRPPGQDDTPASALDRLHPTRSEDELSGGSGSPSSRRQHRGGSVTPSSASSRNQSPRTVAAEARLRQAAAPRKTSQRNSANLGASSNLQEELFRLINPDYISDSDASREGAERPRAYSLGVPTVSRSTTTTDKPSTKAGGAGGPGGERNNPPMHLLSSSKPPPPQATSMGYRSHTQQPHPALVPPMARDSPPDGQQQSTQQTEVAEVVVLTARPATVISNSSASSPAPATEQKGGLAADHRLRGQKDSKGHGRSDPPEDKKTQDSSGWERGNGPGLDVDQEWTSLVNTATQAIEKSVEVGGGPARPPPPAPSQWPPHHLPQHRAGDGSGGSETPILHDRVVQLERRLAAEQQRSEQLEDEVSQLRSENRKLQEDSRAAAQQLHQFTEWFFNTIDKT